MRGGQVVIEVSDDGKGLDRKAILTKAIERSLVSSEKAAKMSDGEICDLIFLPGFSTAKQITAVSGRGVGMDVVRTNVEKIGGSVEITSTQGKGTSIQLRIPLTLAIVPALLVKSKHIKFAIPQVKLTELVRVGKDTQSQIEYLQNRPMYRLRGSLLPLLDIREVTKDSSPRDYSEEAFIVVLTADAGDRFGLIVGEIMDTADIVVKPLSTILKNINVFSGATILGDGSLALILDVSGLAAFGKVLSKRTRGNDNIFGAKVEIQKNKADEQDFLLFLVGTETKHAIPLCLVQRLEEFSIDSIEYSGELRVTRYRNALLPLIDLRTFLSYPLIQKNEQKSDRIQVIVIERSGQSYGFVVNEILDVITVNSSIDDSLCDREGILGNLIYEEHVIVVVDTLSIVDKINPTIKKGKSTSKITSFTNNNFVDHLKVDEIKAINRELKQKTIRILYAEDVAFFRRQVSKVLIEAGYEVTTAEDGLVALELLEKSELNEFNLILSDIEMPKMNGIELAKEVRKRKQFEKLPMIALTTRFRDKDIAEGLASGFNLYLEKLNPEKLLAAVQSIMDFQYNKSKENEAQL